MHDRIMPTGGTIMRTRLLLASTVLSLTACTQPYYWAKPGATQASFNADRAMCLQQAYQAAPTAITPYTIGSGYTSPGTATCTGFGNMINCTSYPGTYTPPPTITLDTNTRARNEYFEACMLGLGYSKTTEPYQAQPDLTIPAGTAGTPDDLTRDRYPSKPQPAPSESPMEWVKKLLKKEGKPEEFEFSPK